MNGVVEITIEGETHTLRFGVQACMLFQDMSLKNPINPLISKDQNTIKLISELFHCGLFGDAVRNGRATKNIGESMDLFDKFGEELHFADSCKKIWDAWAQSKWGSDLIALGEEVKKKWNFKKIRKAINPVTAKKRKGKSKERESQYS